VSWMISRPVRGSLKDLNSDFQVSPIIITSLNVI
jgi:hypothetical protein